MGSLIGKATKIDMKYTREHGVVRARIDCVNLDAIPIRLDHWCDGEGFAIYFDIEAPDGSIIPAIESELNNGNGKNGQDEEGNNEEKNDGTDSSKEFSKEKELLQRSQKEKLIIAQMRRHQTCVSNFKLDPLPCHGCRQLVLFALAQNPFHQNLGSIL
jgi:hypothetical protein